MRLNPFRHPSDGAGAIADRPAPDAAAFERGARTVADLIAPAAVEVARDHLRLEREYARTLAVTAYPRTVGPGWLAPLVDADLPVELSLHVAPQDSAQTVRLLGHRLAQLESSRRIDERGGRLPDPEREVAYEDAERLRDALQRGEERVFGAGLYLALRAPSLPELDALTRRVEATLDGMLAHSRPALLEQPEGLRACLPEGRDALGRTRNLDTSSLATMLPFATRGLATGDGVLYGIAAGSSSPVLLDPFDPGLENANAVVVATSGAGKSYFTKLIALRCLLAGVELLVVDPEGEYGALCAAAGGQRVRLAAAGGNRLNPFDLPPPTADDADAEERDPLAAQVSALLGLLEIMLAAPDRPLDVHERAALDRALYATYAAAGISADRATHARPAPLLRDLQAALEAAEGAVVRGLAARLRPYVGGALAGLFDGPTSVDLDRRLVVFDAQALEPELRPLAIHLITAHVWRRVRRARRPRLLVVDEAWSVLQYPEGGAFLAGMARRARKYYLGLVTITQNAGDLLAAAHGRAVAANAATKLLLKQDATTIEAVADAFALSAGERRLLLSAGKGEGLLLCRGRRVPLRIVAGPAEHRLATTAPQDASPSPAPELPARGRPRTREPAATDAPAATYETARLRR